MIGRILGRRRRRIDADVDDGGGSDDGIFLVVRRAGLGGVAQMMMVAIFITRRAGLGSVAQMMVTRRPSDGRSAHRRWGEAHGRFSSLFRIPEDGRTGKMVMRMTCESEHRVFVNLFGVNSFKLHL